jgi:hypothetical protein
MGKRSVLTRSDFCLGPETSIVPKIVNPFTWPADNRTLASQTCFGFFGKVPRPDTKKLQENRKTAVRHEESLIYLFPRNHLKVVSFIHLILQSVDIGEPERRICLSPTASTIQKRWESAFSKHRSLCLYAFCRRVPWPRKDRRGRHKSQYRSWFMINFPTLIANRDCPRCR